LKKQDRAAVGARFLGVFSDAVRGERMERLWMYELLMYVHVADARGVEAVPVEVGVV
jgi:hypothetical protein